MEIEELATKVCSQLETHEANSQARAEWLAGHIKHSGETTMETPHIKNIFTPAPAAAMPVMGGDGLGFGGGGLGALLAVALLGGRGLGAGYGAAAGADCVGPLLNVGIDGVNHNINNAAIGINHNINTSLQGLTTQLNNGFGAQRDITTTAKLGDIEGAIWQAEGQAQLAIATAQNDINANVAANLLTTVQGQNLINQNIANANSANLIGQGDIKATILAANAAAISATKDSQYAVTTAIRDDGDKTRAQIALYHEATLQRELGVAQAALAEQRTGQRVRESEINITNTNTAIAAQAQSQTQQQQQIQLLVQQNALLSNLANDIQVVRQGQTIFNSGTMAASGTQAAANTKVN